MTADRPSHGAATADRLERAVAEVLDDVARLPSALIHWKPADAVWSVMDNLCHIREFVPFWMEQTQQIIRQPDTAWGRDHTDAGRLAAVTNTADLTLDDVVGDIRRAVDRAAATLRQWTDQELATEATSRNPRFGRKPASFVVDDLLAGHVEKHRGQIRRNVTQYGDRHPDAYPLLFPAPPVAAVPVEGQPRRVAIRRIFCVGRNYEAHAREMGVAADREAPFYFTKSAVHYVPSGASVPYPPGTSNYHYEIELVAVMGASAFEVSAEQALTRVFGYACGLDMTRRDLQIASRDVKRPWDLGKDVELSAVVSAIVPAAQIGHPRAGRIELRVNGETKQSSDLSLLVHSVPEIVAHLSRFYHLEAGDLIFTGTPEGVGPVKPGDALEGSIADVGTVSLTIDRAD